MPHKTRNHIARWRRGQIRKWLPSLPDDDNATRALRRWSGDGARGAIRYAHSWPNRAECARFWMGMGSPTYPEVPRWRGPIPRPAVHQRERIRLRVERVLYRRELAAERAGVAP